jgi:ribosomal protein S4E
MSTMSAESLKSWLANEPVAGLQFAHDELVTILAGEHAGMVGSLISVEQIEPDVIYLVEVDSGFNVPARQADIERVD